MLPLVPYRRRNDDFFGQMLRSLNEVLDSRFTDQFDDNARSFRTDIREGEHAYVVEAELPGFTKDEISIDYRNKYLTIRAKHDRVDEKKDENDKVIRKERHYGEYVRRFYVEGIDEEGIKAKLKDGMLHLDIPKKAKAEPEAKRIEIE